MLEIVVRKGPNNTFIPATDEDAGKVAKYKLGQPVTLRSTKLTDRAYKFHQKLVCLYKLCYDSFVECVDAGLEYRGTVVKPSFDNFREELTILSGHYEAHHSLNGTVRVRGKSIAYHNMGDDEKERLYSDLINAALRHVYRGDRSEEELRSLVEQILAFDR